LHFDSRRDVRFDERRRCRVPLPSRCRRQRGSSAGTPRLLEIAHRRGTGQPSVGQLLHRPSIDGRDVRELLRELLGSDVEEVEVHRALVLIADFV